MKRKYIKPYTETIYIQIESLMQTMSPTVESDQVGVTGEMQPYNPDLNVDNSGNTDGVTFSKGNSLWDDQW